MAVGDKTVALVTGANQGIGYEVSKKLAKQNGYHVVMAGRNEKAIKAAAETLQKKGLDVEPLILDLSSEESMDSAFETYKKKFDHLDVLVNNAGIAHATPTSDNPRPVYEQIIGTNLIGTISVTERLLPLLNNSKRVKRVVFVSSDLGSLAGWAMPGSTNRVFNGPAYCVSKTALNALCLQYAVAYEDDSSWKFNSCCPGYCSTKLNQYSGVKTAEAGAQIICDMATIGVDGPSGTYSNSEGLIPW